MIEILIFILPTFFSLIIHDKIANKEKNLYNIVKNFGGYCCLINIIMMFILFLYRTQDFEIHTNMQMFDFVFKYFAVASIIAIALPIILEFIERNVNIKLIFKEIKNEENNKE